MVFHCLNVVFHYGSRTFGHVAAPFCVTAPAGHRSVTGCVSPKALISPKDLNPTKRWAPLASQLPAMALYRAFESFGGEELSCQNFPRNKSNGAAISASVVTNTERMSDINSNGRRCKAANSLSTKHMDAARLSLTKMQDASGQVSQTACQTRTSAG
jgi:hypothetical protein